MTREREYFFGEDRMRGGFGGRGGPPRGGGGGFVHKSHLVKQLKETMQQGHRTGLNQKILDYFKPRDPLQPGTELKKKKLPVPFTGLAAYVDKFAESPDPEEVKDAPTKPRLFRNPELALQCRLNTETKTEK
jgi:U1 small nuclear ribonucleoprotein